MVFTNILTIHFYYYIFCSQYICLKGISAMKNRFRIFPFLCMAALVTLSFSAGAKTQTNSLELDAAGIEHNARLVNLRFDRPNGLISLDNTELIEDDGPATGVPEGYDYRGDEWKEDLKKGIVIKKILMVDNPEAWSGRLVFKALEVKGNKIGRAHV